MKKIILAVASVLALGMLVSCKQEVSGNLTVTDIQYDAFKTTTETYYYKVEGSVESVTEVTNTTKATASSDATTASKTTTTSTMDVDSANSVVTVTVSKDPTTNVTTYKINVPALEGKKKVVQTIGNTTTTYYQYDSQEATTESNAKEIKQIGSSFYYKGEVIEGLNPTAASFDLSKLAEKDKSTSTSGAPSYTADGEKWYSSKTVTTTTPTYSLTYTKL